jgi:hypothetical protein
MTKYNKDNQGKPFNIVPQQVLTPIIEKQRQDAKEKLAQVEKDARRKINGGKEL